MYTRIFIILLSCLSFFSCKPEHEEDPTPPDYVLEEQTFINVLTDCYLGEGAAGINVKNVSGEKYDSTYIFNPFKDNGITKAQLDTTIVYYAHYPKKLKKIYEKILDNLSRIQAIGFLGGNSNKNDPDKYKSKDILFYYTESKRDSVINAGKLFGYSLNVSYGFKK